MFKKLAIIIGLGFYFTGCMTANSIRQAVQPQNVETFSELEWADPYPKPEWVSNGGVDTEEHLFFVGVSTKRQDERNASREASNDALLKYIEYCGVDIQYIQEHTDSEIGFGGAIKTSTFGKQGSIARINAHVSRSKVVSSYKEKYRNFHGGMFLSHSFKTAVLLRVPKEVVANCKNTSVIAQFTPEIKVVIKPKASTCNIVCDNLVGFYLFNSDVKDLSSFKNHGKNKGAKFVTDQNRKSILLNGNDDFVIFKNFTTSKGNIDSDSFSISVVVKFASLSNKWVTHGGQKFAMNSIIGSDTSFLDLGYLSFPGDRSKLEFGTRSTNWQTIYVGHTDPLSFQHIVAVASKQDKKISIYVDGALRGTTDWDGLNVTSKDLMLGKRGIETWGGSGYANIIVDELRIYNKALTKNEVDLLYQGVSTEVASL